MIGLVAALAVALNLGAAAPPTQHLAAIPDSAQSVLMRRYLTDLAHLAFDDAYGLLNSRERAYYRDARNFRSVFAADEYRIERFALVGMRAGGRNGSVFFARETARYRDHAHDVDLRVTATVPIGVVADGGVWRIKDPGHPWRAFGTRASNEKNQLRVTVKKVSFFSRRIETVVTFANFGTSFVTLLPYGKSLLSDAAGTPYRILETRDWALTDKTLFEGLRLAPNAQYTGMLAFRCPPMDNASRTFALRVAPLLADRADTPFAIDVGGISAAPLPGAK